jgi:hypothetical protein
MRSVFVALCLVCLGCATAQPPPVSPTPARESSEDQSFLGEPSADSKKAPKWSVPPAPAKCEPLASHGSRSNASCPAPEAALSALDEALGQADTDERDARLAEIEDCDIGGKGLLVALRADLGPTECADAIIGTRAEDTVAALTTVTRDALKGLSLAAKLSRLVREPPRAQPPYTKERVRAFVSGTMAQWVTEQAQAIQALALEGSRLSSYGKGVVAIEAGLADMRFVEAFREVPLPQEYVDDAELTEAYYASLDQALEPRKLRGRDAALVGLRALADLGTLRDPRVSRARELLSRLFNGRRIDALDGLLLPPLPAPDPKTTHERLAARLPAFYSTIFLHGVDVKGPAMTLAFLQRGMPDWLRPPAGKSDLMPETAKLVARGIFERGRTYWRAEDFRQAGAIADRVGGSEDMKLLGALARALEQGPQDAAAMMLRGPMPQGVGAVSELDALARGGGAAAGFAAYDAAFILELVPPTERATEFFDDLALRYRRAAQMLSDPRHQTLARERAEAAEATAKAVP